MELPYNWLRASLCRDLAPKWIDRASTPSGLFVPGLDRKWQRSGPSLATVVSQSRLLYVFAEAYRIDGAERYLEAVKSGANCLLRAFRDPEYGASSGPMPPTAASRMPARCATVRSSPYSVWPMPTA